VTTIEGQGLACSRGGAVIFSGLDFTVGPGERLGVLGPSGSGKTSLLAIIAGLASASAGQLLIDGVPVSSGLRRNFAVVLQGYGLVSLLTAGENVEVGLRAAGHSVKTVGGTAKQALADVGLEAHEDHLIEELSGGQQQRVAVARAIALAPDVLIADEPTAEQDPGSRALVLDRLFEISDRGGSLVLATHDPEVAERCTRVVHIRA
jgi:putative ABC transport system ATP-binding protein